MKLRNILITAAAVGFMFASTNRTGVVGYTAGDYTDMNTFAHKAAGQNVAWTAGDNFNAVWTDDGTTWGFSGGSATELVNMKWSNGTYGLAVGLDMNSGEVTAADTMNCGTNNDEACNNATTAAAAETTFDLGFGMNLMGWDVGFGMNTIEDGPMNLNARGGCGFWAFDTMTVGYFSAGDNTVMDFSLYGVQDWGAATGFFGLGITMDDDETAWHKGEMTINTNFSVESTLTDWCDLRIGYSKSFNMAAEVGGQESTDSFSAGVGFNYGSVGLDMTLSEGVLGKMMSNPLEYVNGRNVDDPITTSWTLTYTW